MKTLSTLIGLVTIGVSYCSAQSITERGARTLTFKNSVSENDLTHRKVSLRTDRVIREMDVSLNPNVAINIDYKNFEIKTWSENKVKIEVNIRHDASKPFDKNLAWESLNIQFSSNGKQVRIRNKQVGAITIRTIEKAQTLTGFPRTRENVGLIGIQKDMVIYVPEKSYLDIESSYSNILTASDLANLVIKMENCAFQCMNVGSLKVNAQLSNMNTGNVEKAILVFDQGVFVAKNINSLDVNSKTSIFELQDVDRAEIQSNNDTYELFKVGTLRCQKKLGSIRIEEVSDTLDVTAQNTDIKVRKVALTFGLIKLVNSLANVSLPLINLKNYSIAFTGTNTTVYAPFAIQSDQTATEQTVYRFTHQEGAKLARQPNMTVACNSCTVDFK